MKPSPVWMRACAVGLLALSSAAHGRDPVATLTMVDGQAMVIHAATKLSAAEGGAISAQDIVETSPTTSLIRLEFKGAVLDIGPSSRVMIKPSLADASDGALVYVLEGWVKLMLDKPSAPGKTIVASPMADIVGLERDVVAQVKGKELALFAESGAVQAVVRGLDGKASPFKIERGAFLTRHVDGPVARALRPSAAFIQAVPRAFMDQLPLRAALFSGKDISLKPVPGRLSYADTEAWLHAEPRVRSRFLVRWRPLLQDQAYRRALSDQMALHPEWRNILFPPQPGSKASSTTDLVKP